MGFRGQIEDFPEEVVERMLEEQVRQGNDRDITVFEQERYSYRADGGFNWDTSLEGWSFWDTVISYKRFDRFFKKYPKEEEEATKPSAIDNQVGGSHYKSMKIQPIEYIMANNIPFAEGNIIKYVSRWRNKNGVEDLKKAKHMIELLIEENEAK